MSLESVIGLCSWPPEEGGEGLLSLFVPVPPAWAWGRWGKDERGMADGGTGTGAADGGLVSKSLSVLTFTLEGLIGLIVFLMLTIKTLLISSKLFQCFIRMSLKSSTVFFFTLDCQSTNKLLHNHANWILQTLENSMINDLCSSECHWSVQS